MSKFNLFNETHLTLYVVILWTLYTSLVLLFVLVNLWFCLPAALVGGLGIWTTIRLTTLQLHREEVEEMKYIKRND